MSIARQQEIKGHPLHHAAAETRGNAITLAATANNGRIIEEPMPAGIVSPKAKNLYDYLCHRHRHSLGIIFLLNLLRFRIEGHTDVESSQRFPLSVTSPYRFKQA